MEVDTQGQAISLYYTGNITVGYEFTSYTTTEGSGMVEICAVIYQPPTGGATRQFVVSSTTRDGSASKILYEGKNLPI